MLWSVVEGEWEDGTCQGKKEKKKAAPANCCKEEGKHRMLPTGCRKAEGGASMVPTGFSEAVGECKDGILPVGV